MLGLPRADVRRALRQLAERELLRQVGDRYALAPDLRANPDDIPAMVSTWVKGLSEMATKSLGPHDLRRLEQYIHDWVTA